MLNDIAMNSKCLEYLYNKLRDDSSKRTFEWFVKYRISYMLIGEKAVELFPSPIKIQDFEEKLGTILKRENSYEIAKGGKVYKFYFENEKFTEPVSLNSIWNFGQYEYGGNFFKFGDVIIDGGAGYGDSALFFSSKIGESGKVVAVEPDSRMYNFLIKNIKENGAKNIIPLK